MSNPVLNRNFESANAGLDAGMGAQTIPTTHSDEVMTYGGTVRATGILLGLALLGAIYGWTSVESGLAINIPGWFFAALIGGLVLAIVTVFRPQWSPITGPIYAIVEGVLLGAITRIYEVAFEGIAFQALLATGVTVMVMLVLWATRTIRVTERLRSAVVGATLGVAAFYLITIVMSLFGATMPLVWDSGPLGIGFSLVVIAIAAFNLLLDFDLIERGTAAGAPKYMDWYAAFGLVVTIVWLYLEILRLLAKLRD